LLLDNAPASWDINYFNAVVVGKTDDSPMDLLAKIKRIEKKMGRDLEAPRWSPRIIDIDIIYYGNEKIATEQLTIPHREIKNRDFLQFLLAEVGCEIPENEKMDVNNYSALNHFVLDPKLLGIVNVTPDSFSDGGKFFVAEKAERRARELYGDGATIVEFGAQSTHPGYKEVSPSEEISRLSEVLERCNDMNCLCIDTYFDEVVRYVVKNHHVGWVNDQNSQLNSETIKLIADENLKLVIMLHGTDIPWFSRRVGELENFGMKRENIIVDPGIGFGKNKRRNIEMIKNISILKEFGCEILLGHSRKSFISAFSTAVPEDRDAETIAVSDFAADMHVDYLRIHNVKDHMRFFVAKHCLQMKKCA
jgi:2-amino-4-hydroxy-6-hydroxymethyldihydropteridine diphosphokinase/dihydropteroate synthase